MPRKTGPTCRTTGAMRLGNDAFVLTQTASSRCIAFLSQSLNEGKENVEIPVVCHRRHGQCMEVDTIVQSEAAAMCNLKAIKKFSPFDKYLIGEKAALFSGGTGTQIYVWNLDKWGSNYCLQWYDGLKGSSSFYQGDIFIQSRRIRSRPGQVSVKAYKRVGGMIHNADMGRGVIGVIDVTDLMNDGDGRVWVHNNKQGFQDCESNALLELWLGRKVDEYLDNHFVSLLDNENCVSKPDCEWVQCDKCRKWRVLPLDFDTTLLPAQWFCYLEPFKGLCAAAEQKMEHGVVNVSTKLSEYDSMWEDSYCNDEVDAMKATDERWIDCGFKRLRKGPPNAKVKSTQHSKRFMN